MSASIPYDPGGILQLVTRSNPPKVDRMRKLFPLLLLLSVWLPGAVAQVAVEVTLEQEQFLPGEALPVAVRVANRSGQTLHLGAQRDWLTFSVESRDGFIVRKNGETPVLGEFTLESSQVATKRADVAPYFTLTRPGRYRLTATTRIKEWDGQIASPPKTFDIIEGTKVWTQEFGVPATATTNQPPELRRYTLLHANYLRSQLRLYFRLTDVAESRVFKVFPLGQVVSFGRPETEVDARSHLHVLHQNGARTSIYTVLNPDGEIVIRQTYDYVNVRPHLHLDADGKISVTGAVRRATSSDVPAGKLSEDEPKPAPR